MANPNPFIAASNTPALNIPAFFAPVQPGALALSRPDVDDGVFHSISHDQSLSHEEIRLADYEAGRGVIYRESNISVFLAAMNGLVSAKVSLPALHPFSGRRAPSHTAIPLGTAIVTFRAGTETIQDFTVHESLVTSRSEFVRMALNKDWKEAKERVIPLPEDEPRTFALYQQWLYTNQLASAETADPVKSAQEYRLLVDAYMMGERLLDVKFKNYVINAIIDKLKADLVFDPRLANVVYEGTPSGSPLRRLWQDIYFWAGNSTWLDEDRLQEPLPQAFAVDLSKYQMDCRDGPARTTAPYLQDVHVYHEKGPCPCLFRYQAG